MGWEGWEDEVESNGKTDSGDQTHYLLVGNFDPMEEGSSNSNALRLRTPGGPFRSVAGPSLRCGGAEVTVEDGLAAMILGLSGGKE